MSAPLPMRPFMLADTPRLQDLYAQAIEELTQDEYDEDQRLAWMTRAADAETFAERLGNNLTILVDQGNDILGFASLRGNKEIDDWAVNLVGFCLMISQALLVEAFMHLPAVYVMTKMPFFGDAAERVARSSVEIVVYGYTEAIVMATIAFYAATDAIEAHREFRAQEDAMLEARRVKNFSLHGEASDICNKQTIAPGITIESCIGR